MARPDGLDQIPPSASQADVALAQEALRLNDRYLTELVEPFGFCPYAEGARNSPELRRRVVLESDLAGTTQSWLDALADDASGVVGILIYPRFAGSLADFEKLLRELRAGQEARGGSPFVSALFHPHLKYSEATPQRLLTFFRRSPDPALQFVRFSVLEQLKKRAPTGKFYFDGSNAGLADMLKRGAQLGLSERIARDNHARVAEEGIGKLQAILDDIAADRARTYAALGEAIL